MPITLVCQSCGESFQTKPSKHQHKYCSVECRDDAYRQQSVANGSRVDVTCPICGKVTSKTKSQAAKGRCCSTQCRGKYLAPITSKLKAGKILKRVERVCPTCGTLFSVPPSNPKTHCNQTCANNDPRKAEWARQHAIALWENPETRAKLEAGIAERSQSEEWRNAPHFQSGENHPRWKGGKQRQRETEMSRYDYKKWRTQVFQRDGYTCQECGKHGGRLTAHHIEAWAEAPHLRYAVDNGITLCESCHDAMHGLKRRPKMYHCVDCGKLKTSSRSPRCHSCASKHGHAKRTLRSSGV